MCSIPQDYVVAPVTAWSGHSSSNKQMLLCFLLGNSTASEFYMPTFRNTLFHLHRLIGMKNDWGWECWGIYMGKGLAQKLSNQSSSRINTPKFSTPDFLHTYPLIKMEQTECPEMSAYKIQKLGNYPEESTQHSEHDESLKSKTNTWYFYLISYTIFGCWNGRINLLLKTYVIVTHFKLIY